MISFADVTKRYPGGAIAVSDLDLEIPSGRTTVLVGPSGCGKTTTLRMINRMVEPTSGSITIDGVDVRSQDPPVLRRSIGYVIQQAGLFPHRTILDNVATVPLLLGTPRRQARSRAQELMELVGLSPDLARRYPHQLSGGQQQRVGVARALAADPPVLLMDEPFSAVDPVVRASLQEELLRLQNELHKTIVFVTHDIDEAVRIGDQIAVFRPGGVLAQVDSPVHLLASPRDEFVERFVGYDRGVRRLSFFAARDLDLDSRAVVTADSDVAAARRLSDAGEPWLLVVDDERRPLGWVSAETLAVESGIRPVGELPLESYGHIFHVETDSLRAALDSAVLSPAGRAVGVDAQERVVGIVAQADLGSAIWSVGNSADKTLVAPDTESHQEGGGTTHG
ncbi:ATP-binding cassette domain-containing protein [Spiractinospora alimapuensis]|uniref:ABC transporter ATP-binding protein n=1 Tax=Spiractinospora alimapuensis TaxID=2820884 RepID=UPI001F439095|nr:ATP-binding cassette domain-containing protein [Spiractinospora alimapuensis]QVQ54088.1 ATP-binding cassette domain-containing protein [Spiractinospora alimapuensis]